ncbi:outer membrane protein OmpK [Acinetobacter populi]|jgi:nucleoside-specific outer membrane channel protein Tsx|uniref:Ion channel protein Tsx n=1 Tax=Acinetobacter populi TaxID=1582270 RepID=A0A1Z9Z3I6_9GAMM|nr:outer membrane protein OmpK [Acinetobacter populi]MCH4248155.1 ion channel protein Tsx [Acinetobacter populi]OUY09006.1 ion channel protein Tsx [Acinetobacter populi]
MKKLGQILFSTTIFYLPIAAYAEPIWQDFSITGLYGTNYELTPDEKQTTVTFEYAAKLKYGDFFGFADRTESGGQKDTYFEVSPRLSLGATTGYNMQFGILKDVLLSTTWEGGDNMNNYLYGLGFDLDIPYFQYASLNVYRAKNDLTTDDWQLTLTYGVPFKLGSEDFLFDGFLDWSTEEDDHESEMNWTSQLKWNVGKHISPDTKLYLGIEYSNWTNKYGVPDKDERNVSALVKYHF